MEEDKLLIKSCCADFYRSDIVRLLLGDVLHPGGLELTRHLGEAIALGEADMVLDIACGRGASAIHLATTFGCHVTGLDFSCENLATAVKQAESAGVSCRTAFMVGDGERLPFEDGKYDAVISECSLCIFPDKEIAAGEMARVLVPGGRIGITDMALEGDLPADMQTLLSWVACVGGAASVEEYLSLFDRVGLTNFHVEDNSQALKAMVAEVRRKLLGVEVAAGLGTLGSSDVDLTGAKELLKRASRLVDDRVVGYTLITAEKSRSPVTEEYG